MRRRDFLAKSLLVVAGGLLRTSSALAQVPFSFWKVSGNSGLLESTSAILIAAAFSIQPELRVTHALKIVASKAGGAAELQVTHAMIIAAVINGNVELWVSQAMLMAATSASAAELRVSEAILATLATSGSTAELRGSQAMIIVAAK